MKARVALLFMAATLLIAYFAHERGKPAAVPADLRDSLISGRGPLHVPGLSPECLAGELPHRAAVSSAWDASGAPGLRGAEVSPMSQGVFSCLSCHDGTVAPADKSYSATFGGAAGGPEAAPGNHPVGVDYGQALRARPDEYNDPHSNPDIRLSGDKVTCLSCHASELADRLNMPGGQTALCLACHRL